MTGDLFALGERPAGITGEVEKGGRVQTEQLLNLSPGRIDKQLCSPLEGKSWSAGMLARS